VLHILIDTMYQHLDIVLYLLTLNSEQVKIDLDNLKFYQFERQKCSEIEKLCSCYCKDELIQWQFSKFNTDSFFKNCVEYKLQHKRNEEVVQHTTQTQ
jgi:hypothetical protein